MAVRGARSHAGPCERSCAAAISGRGRRQLPNRARRRRPGGYRDLRRNGLSAPVRERGGRPGRRRSVAIGLAGGLPAVVGTALLIRSGLGGDDFQPARWLATGNGPSYGQSYLYAYPPPVYLPALPLAALPTPWSHAAALVVCIGLLGLALWLWRGSWRHWLFLMASTPAVYALIQTPVFSCLVLLGCSLAFWASERRRTPLLLGLGLALAAIRPVNALPLVAGIVWARRAEWRRLAPAAATPLVLCAPFVVWAFVIDRRWPLDYIAMLRAYPVAGLIQFVYAAGPLAYLAALIALAALSPAIAASRGSEAGAAAGLAVSVAAGPLPEARARSFALPALMVAGRRTGYEWLPGIASAIGWLATISLLTVNLAPAIAAYWYVVNSYPLLRAPRTRPSSVPLAASKRPNPTR